MRKFWFAVIVVLMLGVMAGLYDRPNVTGQFIANLPPEYDYPTAEFSVDDSFELDLNDAFFDPDGSALSFSVESDESVAAGLRGSRLVVQVFDEGSVYVTASDGNYQVVKRLRFRT